MTPNQLWSKHKANLTFALALVLLLTCAIGTASTVSRFSNSAKMVAHTYQVRMAISEIDSTLSSIARSWMGYISSGDQTFVDQFSAAEARIPGELQTLHDLTRDNPTQQRLYQQLQELISRRTHTLDAAMSVGKADDLDSAMQSVFGKQFATAASQTTSITNKMVEEETRLLGQRVYISGRLFNNLLSFLVFSFVLAIFMLWLHYRFLGGEIRDRREAQNNARRLSARILTLQDQERRKFSRELHDGLGQELVLAKMITSDLMDKNPADENFLQLLKTLDQAIAETRTLSYLLHPPLLDEIGFASAARWFVEGFAKRSGMEISLDVPADTVTVAHGQELALFRVLQESLTNIHKHAKCKQAKVVLASAPGGVILKIQDYGKGIPADTLQQFQTNGTRAGVGLAGMVERVREQGGRLDIQSDRSGTLLSAFVPTETVASVKRGAEASHA